jgi:hypothetical protein
MTTMTDGSFGSDSGGMLNPVILMLSPCRASAGARRSYSTAWRRPTNLLPHDFECNRFPAPGTGDHRPESLRPLEQEIFDIIVIDTLDRRYRPAVAGDDDQVLFGSFKRPCKMVPSLEYGHGFSWCFLSIKLGGLPLMQHRDDDHFCVLTGAPPIPEKEISLIRFAPCGLRRAAFAASQASAVAGLPAAAAKQRRLVGAAGIEPATSPV